MIRRETVLLVAFVVALAAAVPANAASPAASVWEQVTAAVSWIWEGGSPWSLKNSGPPTCEQGLTIDPSGCPHAVVEPPTLDPRARESANVAARATKRSR